MLNITQFAHKIGTAMLLSFVAFAISMLLTPVYTHFAFKYKWWKRHRQSATTGEQLKVIAAMRIKRTIPLMAGLVGVIAITLVTCIFNLDRHQTWLPLAALLGGGFVGLIDDVINIRGAGGKFAGFHPLAKLTLVGIVAAFAAFFFYYKLGVNSIHIPFVYGHVHLGWLIIPLFILVLLSTGNAVNISDGMDGLAGGLLLSAYSAYAVIAALEGNFGIASFCMTVAGALLAYLWFNIAPARFIMGDVGSFGFGTALGVVAMQTGTVFLLPVIAFVFVCEAGSTLIQILSKKIRHKKIFIAAPIHHHFEATGWPKTKVTMRFWVVGQVCAALGVMLALLGGYAH